MGWLAVGLMGRLVVGLMGKSIWWVWFGFGFIWVWWVDRFGFFHIGLIGWISGFFSCSSKTVLVSLFCWVCWVLDCWEEHEEHKEQVLPKKIMKRKGTIHACQYTDWRIIETVRWGKNSYAFWAFYLNFFSFYCSVGPSFF